jgi:nicotinamide-nucleotide amidase
VRIESLCTGDELLTGLTADTNSLFFQNQLLDAVGLTVARTTLVPDDVNEIEEAIRSCAARADVLLVSGGLGPTLDDLTAECAARVAGVELIEHQEVVASLESRYAARGVPLNAMNRRQARVPANAEVQLNDEGAAPLFSYQLGHCRCFFVPGVPREFRHLVGKHVVPHVRTMVQQKLEAPLFRQLRLLKTLGIWESKLDETVRPLIHSHPHITFGFRTHLPENHLKLLAKGTDAAEVALRLDLAEADVRALLGTKVFAINDQTLAEVTHQALKDAQATVAVAESCTGGMIATLLTDPPGASTVFLGGAAVYSNDLKTRLSDVPASLIEAHGAVSEPVALALASGIRLKTGATLGLSSTGIAGPGGGTDQKPVGTVYLAVSSETGARAEKHVFFGGRERIRAFAAAAAIDLLRREVKGLS